MRITDLQVDPKSLGNKFWLVGVTAAYEYKNNVRTDNVVGYNYEIALPERGLDKIRVKIDGAKLVNAPENGYVEARLENLDVFIFWSRGDYVWAHARQISQ